MSDIGGIAAPAAQAFDDFDRWVNEQKARTLRQREVTDAQLGACVKALIDNGIEQGVAGCIALAVARAVINVRD